MATRSLKVRKVESIAKDIEIFNESINRRAYEIFEQNGMLGGREMEHWLSAESELFWKPSIELGEKDSSFIVNIAVPGIDASDLEVSLTAEDALIRGETSHQHEETLGDVHSCEFSSGRIFRVVHFPKLVDPDTTKVEFKDGMLKLIAPIAGHEELKTEPKTVKRPKKAAKKSTKRQA